MRTLAKNPNNKAIDAIVIKIVTPAESSSDILAQILSNKIIQKSTGAGAGCRDSLRATSARYGSYTAIVVHIL